jgi:hypothetical protein
MALKYSETAAKKLLNELTSSNQEVHNMLCDLKQDIRYIYNISDWNDAKKSPCTTALYSAGKSAYEAYLAQDRLNKDFEKAIEKMR